MSALFENRKDKIVEVIWIENFSDGRWDIFESSSDYEKLDDGWDEPTDIEIKAYE